MTPSVDHRLRAAVDASVAWYTTIFTSHGIGSRTVDGVWSPWPIGPDQRKPPPFHSAVLTVEPWATAEAVVERAAGLAQCSVADCFAALDLTGAGFEVLFEAHWLHLPAGPSEPSPMPEGWFVLTGDAELAEWNTGYDTTDVLRPDLLGRATFQILARRGIGGGGAGGGGAGDGITGGAIAHLGTGVVGLSNVHAADGYDLAWTDVIAAVRHCFPGRAIVDYERGADLAAALGAGFTPVGTHRVWVR